MKKIVLAACFLGLSVAFSDPSRAALWGGSDESDAWELVFTPYFYSGDLKADVKVDGQEQSFDQGNPLDFTTFASRIRVEAWKNKWGILCDVHYLNLWDEQTLSDGSTAELNSHMWGIETAGSYRYLQTQFQTPVPSDLGLEMIVGARSVFLSADLAYSPGDSQSFNKNWVESMIGHRIIYGLGDRWNFVLKGDVGGFGLGSASKLTWDLAPEVIFFVTEGIYLNAGYDIFNLQTETESGGSKNEVNARTSGPTMGLTIHFSTEGS